MSLTTQQQTTIKNWVLAQPALATLPPSSGAVSSILSALSDTSLQTYYVYNSKTSVDDVFNNVTWANFTPVNPAAGAGTDATNWMLACQGKQFNLQTLLTGRATIDATKANIRAGLQDALTNIPSGVNGATKSGGWIGVQLILSRLATPLEQLFATGSGTQASPSLTGTIDPIGYNDVLTIMGW